MRKSFIMNLLLFVWLLSSTVHAMSIDVLWYRQSQGYNDAMRRLAVSIGSYV